MLLPIHIAAGGLAIVLGAVALIVKKGGPVHRRSGLLFVYAMLIMGFSASMLTIMNGGADGNVVAGVVTAYFVGTALTSVRPASSWTRVINATALTVAVVLIFWSLVSGATFINTPGRDANGVPFRTAGVMSLVVATVLAMAAAGDVRIMRAGMPRGAPRLARHLWRMCFALFIAAGSFFSVPRARGEGPSSAVHDRVDAGAADPAAICGDVLLVVESPPPQGVARARPIRPRACHHAHKVMSQFLLQGHSRAARVSVTSRRIRSAVVGHRLQNVSTTGAES